jgi:hypothetical protein
MLTRIRSASGVWFMFPACLCLAAVLGSCSKKPTEPAPGTLSGDITLATGQTGDLSVAVVIELYLGDPFAAGAVPSQIVVVTGTPTLAHYSFTITHGDFHVVAWKDENLSNTVDSGDLYGWYDGAVNGTGQPVAASVHLDHGQSGVANVAVSVRP